MWQRALALLVLAVIALTGCGGSDAGSAGEPNGAGYSDPSDAELRRTLLGGLTPPQASCAVKEIRATVSPEELAAAWPGKRRRLFPIFAEASEPCVKEHPGPPEDHTVSHKQMRCIIERAAPGGLNREGLKGGQSLEGAIEACVPAQN